MSDILTSFQDAVKDARAGKAKSIEHRQYIYELCDLFKRGLLPKPTKVKAGWFRPTILHCPIDGSPLTGMGGMYFPCSAPYETTTYFISHYACPKCDYEYTKEGF